MTLPLYVPRFITWDSEFFSPCSKYFCPIRKAAIASEVKNKARTDWLWAFLRSQVIAQRSSKLTIPDRLLKLIYWGDKEGVDKSWRRQLRRAIQNITGNVQEEDRDFVLVFPAKALGSMTAFATEEHEGVYSFDFVNTKTTVYLDSSAAARSTRNTRRKLWSFFLPHVVLGKAAGLTRDDVRVFSTITKEITRDRTSSRVDKAMVLTNPWSDLVGNYIPCRSNYEPGSKIDQGSFTVIEWLRRSNMRFKRGSDKSCRVGRVIRRLKTSLDRLQEAFGLRYVWNYNPESRFREMDLDAILNIWLPETYISNVISYLSVKTNLKLIEETYHKSLNQRLKDKISKKSISVSEASKQIGTSTATLYRALKSEDTLSTTNRKRIEIWLSKE